MSDTRRLAGDPVPDAFTDALRRHGGHSWDAAPVVFFQQATSTNDLALALAGDGADEGTVIVALAQTAGRGRRGRSWTSPPGAGVYFTVILRPALHPRMSNAGGPSQVTLLAAVAVAEAVQRVSGVSAQIKWPNDLVIDAGRDEVTGAWRRRKLAGILTEGSVAGAEVQHVVVGVGINLAPAAYPPDVVATSIGSETGTPGNAAEVLAACRASLARQYAETVSSGWNDLLDRWRARAPSSVGYEVRWTDAGHRRAGVTAGLDAEGALVIRSTDGDLYQVRSGEVEWA